MPTFTRVVAYTPLGQERSQVIRPPHSASGALYQFLKVMALMGSETVGRGYHARCATVGRMFGDTANWMCGSSV
jgi:hypothetical protein